jgi:hypothetical protein
MGILNVTPDSFSDGGQFFDQDIALGPCPRDGGRGRGPDRRGRRIDPPRRGRGARVAEEIRRTAPLIAALRAGSWPRRSPSTPARQPWPRGAGRGRHDGQRRGGADPRPATGAAGGRGEVPLCLMHAQGSPADDAGRSALRRRAAGRLRFPRRRGWGGRGGGHPARPDHRRSGHRLRQDGGAQPGADPRAVAVSRPGLSDPAGRLAQAVHRHDQRRRGGRRTGCRGRWPWRWRGGQGVQILRVHDVPQPCRPSGCGGP